MASSMVLKRFSSLVMGKLLHPLRSSSAIFAPSPRSFTTNAQVRDSEDDERHLDIQRNRPRGAVRSRDSPPNFFSDVFDPLSPTRSLSQVLNMMDHLMNNPFNASSRGGRRVGLDGGLRRGWDAKEDNDALHLRIDMPGLGKEDVKVSMEQDTLVIRGEGEKEGDGDEESGRSYSSRINLPPKIYNFDGIKAEMKNGVLKVLVPKVKEDERKDVRQVQVQ